MSSDTLQGKLSRLKSEFSVFFDRLTQQAREEFQGVPKTALNEETEKLWEEFRVIHLNTHKIKNALEVFLQERHPSLNVIKIYLYKNISVYESSETINF